MTKIQERLLIMFGSKEDTYEDKFKTFLITFYIFVAKSPISFTTLIG